MPDLQSSGEINRLKPSTLPVNEGHWPVEVERAGLPDHSNQFLANGQGPADKLECFGAIANGLKAPAQLRVGDGQFPLERDIFVRLRCQTIKVFQGPLEKEFPHRG